MWHIVEVPTSPCPHGCGNLHNREYWNCPHLFWKWTEWEYSPIERVVSMKLIHLLKLITSRTAIAEATCRGLTTSKRSTIPGSPAVRSNIRIIIAKPHEELLGAPFLTLTDLYSWLTNILLKSKEAQCLYDSRKSPNNSEMNFRQNTRCLISLLEGALLDI